MPLGGAHGDKNTAVLDSLLQADGWSEESGPDNKINLLSSEEGL